MLKIDDSDDEPKILRTQINYDKREGPNETPAQAIEPINRDTEQTQIDTT